MFRPESLKTCMWVLAALAVCALFFAPSAAAGDYAEALEKMVEETIEARDVTDSLTLAAMRSVPRHQFVSREYLSRAYDDTALPIGHGQTISQPYIVAAMTELLNLDENSKVLEIGTGSGYQAAVLGEIADRVYTIEIVEELASSAAERLERLGYTNITAAYGDGYHGWPEHAPYDGIVVTAAATHIPPPLLEQLKPGGWLVIPVGSPMQVQYLMLAGRKEDGTVSMRSVMPVTFVPFTRMD